MNMLTYMAVLLDPRNKLEVLGYVLDDIFGESLEEKIKFVIDTATLFNKYKAKYGTIKIKKERVGNQLMKVQVLLAIRPFLVQEYGT